MEAEELGSLFLAWSTIHAFWLCSLMVMLFKKEISLLIDVHLEILLVMVKELLPHMLIAPNTLTWLRWWHNTFICGFCFCVKNLFLFQFIHCLSVALIILSNCYLQVFWFYPLYVFSLILSGIWYCFPCHGYVL